MSAVSASARRLLLLLASLWPLAASADRGAAIDWLAAVQHPEEGAWEAVGAVPAGLELRALTTAAVAEALGPVDLTGDPALSAEVWLRSRATWSTAEAAAVVEALVAKNADATAAVAALASMQRPDGLWGAWRDWEPDPSATARAVRAMGLAGRPLLEVQAAMDWLESLQRTTPAEKAGAWGWDAAEHVSAPVHVEDTARALMALAAYEDPLAPSTVVDDGIAWLLEQQNDAPFDKGFGDDPDTELDSTVVETALAILALCETGRPSGGALDEALAWLLAVQDAEGHWGGADVEATALALRALGCGRPNLLVAAADWTVPATLVSGSSVDLVAETIRNAGYAGAPSSQAQVFYRAGPSEAEVPLDSHVVAAIPAEGSLGVPALTQAGWMPADGSWEACIRVDSGPGVDESDELDNVTCKPIVVGPALDLLIENVSVVFDPAEAGEAFTLDFRVRNAGSQEATDVLVEIWATAPDGAGEERIATFPPEGDPPTDVGAGLWQDYSKQHGFAEEGTAGLRITASLRSGAADPTPADNEHVESLDVVAPADLAVSAADIQVSELEPATGESVEVQYLARNVGGTDLSGVSVVLRDGPGGTVLHATGPETVAAESGVTTGGLATVSLADGCHELWVEVTEGDARDQPTANDAASQRVCWNVPQTNPVATISVGGGSGGGPEGQPIALSGALSSDGALPIVQWDWDLDLDGEHDDASGAEVAVTFVAPGTHSIGLLVTDSEGYTNATTAQVVVSDVPTAVDGGPDVTLVEDDWLTAWSAKVVDAGLMNSTDSFTVQSASGSYTGFFGVSGYWRFDDDLADGSGGGDAMGIEPPMSAATFVADGRHRNALSLNQGTASGEWVGVDYPDDDSITRGDLSVSLWVRRAAGASEEVTLFSLAHPINPSVAEFRLQQLADDTLRLERANQPRTTTESFPFDGATWYHVVACWRQSDGAFALYVDGDLKLSGEDLVEGGGLLDHGFLMVGHDQDPTGDPLPGEADYVGEIDELRVYGRYLSEAEVDSLHADPGQLLQTQFTLSEAAVALQAGHYPDDAVDVHEIRLDGGAGECLPPACAEVVVTAENAAPVADWGLHDLSDWTAESHPTMDPDPCLDAVPPTSECVGNWNLVANDFPEDGVTTTDGSAVQQSENNTTPTVLTGGIWSNHSIVDVDLRVPGTSLSFMDDDDIGFVIGYRPDEDLDFDHLLLDWRASSLHPSGNPPGTERLALSRITGPGPDLVAHLQDVEELALADEIGSSAWEYGVTYHFSFELLPDRTRVWLDGALRFDIDGCYTDGMFGFYTRSQEDAVFANVRQAVYAAPEGSPVHLVGYHSDVGLADDHHVDVAWADGLRTTLPLTTSQGEGSFSVEHVYSQDGTYHPNLCLGDDDGGKDCTLATVRVSNVPPSVSASDLTWTEDEPAVLTASFTDPGILDTHRATVDWGDGEGPVPATVVEQGGSGTVTAIEPAEEGEGSLPDDVHEVELCVEEIPRALEDRTDFAWVGFDEPEPLLLAGSAQTTVDDGQTVVRLTGDANQAGSAFWPDAVPVNAEFSFSSVFELRMGDGQGGADGDGAGADGLAFVLAASASASGSIGGSLGIDGLSPSLAVEFDVWDDGTAQDGDDGNHVAIDLDGDPSSVVRAPVAGTFVDGASRWAWVEYFGDTKRLEVRLSDDAVRPTSPLVSHQVDLQEHFGSELHVGFSATTHAAHADQDLRSWSFTTSHEPRWGCREVGPASDCTRVALTLDRNDPPNCPGDSAASSTCRKVELAPVVSDPDQDDLSWSWTQLAGAAVSFGPSTGSGAQPVTAATEITLDPGNDPCGATATVQLTVDDGELSCSTTYVLTFEDQVAPVLNGVEADVTVSCDAVPSPPMVTASDACDPSPTLGYEEVRTDGPCGDTYTLTRKWTATDACGNTVQGQQVLTVQDTAAPVLGGVPAGATVTCDAVPPPASVTATDACDPSPTLDYQEVRTDGPCGDTYTLTRTWTATDACGNSVQQERVLVVQDTAGPVLSGVPADVTVECDAVPAAASPTATDACDPSPELSFSEERTDGACPHDYALTRTWTATDRCGNETVEVQVVTVEDTTPPVVTENTGVLDCLWPPNHQHVTYTTDDFSPGLEDNCSDPEDLSWVIESCTSDQPDDATGNGDGSTTHDCVVAADGLSVDIRAERAGREPAGRYYTLTAIATDECGNASAETTVGLIHVPHDHRRRQVHDCISAHD